MTRYGLIRQGSIVLDHPVELPEGAEVEIEIKSVGAEQLDKRQIEKLSAGISFDFNALDTQHEASKL